MESKKQAEQWKKAIKTKKFDKPLNNSEIMQSTEWTTEFGTAEKTMTQICGNGVKIVTDFNRSITGVYVAGDLKSTYHNLSIREYVNLQHHVEKI